MPDRSSMCLMPRADVAIVTVPAGTVIRDDRTDAEITVDKTTVAYNRGRLYMTTAHYDALKAEVDRRNA